MLLTIMISAVLQAGGLPVQKAVHEGGRARMHVKSGSRAPAASGRRRAPGVVSGHRGAAFRVVVDAGHGGPDGGAPMRIGGDLSEKDITLQVAMKVGQALRASGVDVIYTRTTDTLIALSDRGHIANQAGADVFVSIHVNAANPRWKDPGAARGFETFFLAEAKTEDARRVEAMENESVRFESQMDAKQSDALSFILRDMEQNQYLRESSDFAEIVQRRLARVHPGPNRGVKQAGFVVLTTAFMPAVLVEIGFGTNETEAGFLASSAKQSRIARAVADATLEYLQRYERRVGGGSAGAVPGVHE